jgi:hypothetical protein
MTLKKLKFALKTIVILPVLPLIWAARDPNYPYYGDGCEGRANKMHDWWHSR